MGFPGSSDGKESACNAGDPSLIPASERSPGDRIGYPFQYSWASLLAQMIKNPPAMRETWVRSWVGKIHGRGDGNSLQCSCLENPMDRGPWQATVHGIAELDTTE